jgi:hypothetical protein
MLIDATACVDSDHHCHHKFSTAKITVTYDIAAYYYALKNSSVRMLLMALRIRCAEDVVAVA